MIKENRYSIDKAMHVNRRGSEKVTKSDQENTVRYDAVFSS